MKPVAASLSVNAEVLVVRHPSFGCSVALAIMSWLWGGSYPVYIAQD